jgi:hypothetical protein
MTLDKYFIILLCRVFDTFDVFGIIGVIDVIDMIDMIGVIGGIVILVLNNFILCLHILL